MLRRLAMGSVCLLLGGWCQAQCELQPLTSEAGSQFGYSIAVDGDRVVVGAPYKDELAPDSGAAYLFERVAFGDWRQVRKLTGPYSQLAISGVGVAIDQDRVAVGIPNDVTDGYVKIYEKNLGGPVFWGFALISPGNVAITQAFGGELSMDGQTLLVANTFLLVHVFDRVGPGSWVESKALTSSLVKVGDNFGSDVALSGSTALVGSSESDDCVAGAGAVYVFERNLGGAGNWGESHVLCASDASFQSHFGGAVAIDGDTAAVSAFRDNTQAFEAGAVYLYERDLGGPGQWGQVRKVVAPDGSDYDWFGNGGSLALQGDTLLVGAIGHDAAGIDAGAVYVFSRHEGGVDNWGLVAQILGSRPGQEFGSSLAIDGLVTVIGARGDDTNGPSAGIAYVFEGVWTAAGISTYCTAGISAAGCQALLSATGTPSATLPSGFFVQADEVEGNRDGVFFFGTSGQQANPWGNGTSYQCVVPPVKRGGLLTGTGTAGLCDGVLAQDLNAHWAAHPNHNPGPGAQVQIQLWYRDPGNTSNQTTSLSEAAQFWVCP